jgi:hypothetical protein
VATGLVDWPGVEYRRAGWAGSEQDFQPLSDEQLAQERENLNRYLER